MAIRKYRGNHARNVIAFYGDEVPAEAERLCKEWRYQIWRLDDESVIDVAKLQLTAALVIAQSDEKPTKFRSALQNFSSEFLKFGCSIYVLVVKSERGVKTHSIVTSTLKELDPPWLELGGAADAREGITGEGHRQCLPTVFACGEAMTWNELLMFVSRNSVKAGVNTDLQIAVEDPWGARSTFKSAYAAEDELLVKRAFSDFYAVKLVEMADGLSGASAYRAYVRHQPRNSGVTREFLMLLKLGDRRIIFKEHDNHELQLLKHIPFHLWPQLEPSRCGLGHKRGMLVSTFVEGAECLRDCATSGHAAAAISNLFQRTLHAWQHHTNVQSERTLWEALQQWLPKQIPTHRLAKIKELGSDGNLDALLAILQKQTTKKFLVGQIHGDLNATNVLVRGSDAIVIDFEKAERNVTLFDLASIESSLLVDSFRYDKRPANALLESLSKLYVKGAKLGEAAPCANSERSSWFYECAREVRRHAFDRELEDGQYGIVLATCLLMKAGRQREYSEQDLQKEQKEQLRACAYILAERILSYQAGHV